MATIACITTHRIQKDLMGLLSFEEVAEKYGLTIVEVFNYAAGLLTKLDQQGKLAQVSYDSDYSDYDWEE